MIELRYHRDLSKVARSSKYAFPIELKIVADKGSSRKDFEFTWLTVRKDLIDEGKVKTPCDLKGRKIGLAESEGGCSWLCPA